MGDNSKTCIWISGRPNCRVDKKNVFKAVIVSGHWCPYCGRKVRTVGKSNI